MSRPLLEATIWEMMIKRKDGAYAQSLHPLDARGIYQAVITLMRRENHLICCCMKLCPYPVNPEYGNQFLLHLSYSLDSKPMLDERDTLK